MRDDVLTAYAGRCVRNCTLHVPMFGIGRTPGGQRSIMCCTQSLLAFTAIVTVPGAPSGPPDCIVWSAHRMTCLLSVLSSACWLVCVTCVAAHGIAHVVSDLCWRYAIASEWCDGPMNARTSARQKLLCRYRHASTLRCVPSSSHPAASTCAGSNSNACADFLRFVCIRREEGDWWASVPDDEWPEAAAARNIILSDFEGDYGDRRQVRDAFRYTICCTLRFTLSGC
jgi:hypothetical protein